MIGFENVHRPLLHASLEHVLSRVCEGVQIKLIHLSLKPISPLEVKTTANSRETPSDRSCAPVSFQQSDGLELECLGRYRQKHDRPNQQNERLNVHRADSRDRLPKVIVVNAQAAVEEANRDYSASGKPRADAELVKYSGKQL